MKWYLGLVLRLNLGVLIATLISGSSGWHHLRSKLMEFTIGLLVVSVPLIFIRRKT